MTRRSRVVVRHVELEAEGSTADLILALGLVAGALFAPAETAAALRALRRARRPADEPPSPTGRQLERPAIDATATVVRRGPAASSSGTPTAKVRRR